MHPVAGKAAAERPQEIEALLGAGEAHVGQAALFLHLVGVVKGAHVGQHPLFQAGDEHHRYSSLWPDAG